MKTIGNNAGMADSAETYLLMAASDLQAIDAS